MSNLQNTAILTMGSLHIAVPQAEIISVDVVADAKPVESENMLCAASLHKQDREWPVYAFNEKFVPRSQLPELCRFFACMQFDDVKFALACDGIELIKLDDETQQQNLPNIMQSNKSPILKLIKFQEGVTLQSDAYSINSYLESLGASNVEQQ